jgi:hypothetical protein
MRFSLLKSGFAAVIAVGLALVSPSKSEATFVIQLEQAGAPASRVTIADNGAFGAGPGTGVDSNGAPGTIVWSGSVGTFTIAITTGLTSGTGVTYTHLSVSTVGPGDLLIKVANTGYTNTTSGLYLNSDVTNNSAPNPITVEYTSYANTANDQFFATTTPFDFTVPAGSATVSTLAPLGTSPNFDHQQTEFTAAGAFSLASSTVIHFTGAGQTANITGNTYVTPSPAPSSAILAIAALPIIGLLGWMRRRKAVAPAMSVA